MRRRLPLVSLSADERRVLLTVRDHAVKPYQRIQYTIDAYKLASTWDWCRAVTLWMSRLPAPANTYFDNYTFLTPDFIPKAIYLEVQRYAHGGQ